jgi:hypothetical protein
MSIFVVGEAMAAEDEIERYFQFLLILQQII